MKNNTAMLKKIVRRMNILRNMDAYVRDNVDDENDFDVWLMLGVPDEADEDMIEEIAYDDEAYFEIIRIFKELTGIRDLITKWGEA